MKVELEPNIKDNPASEISDFKEIAVKLKNFNELSPGDIFRALVTDIQPNKVGIRFANGGGLTARSLVLPEARIGEPAFFVVKENTKGQINLEMLRPQADALKENIAREALISADLYPSAENIKLVKTLMDNNLPIDAPALQKAVYFHYSAANLPIDKIVFLMKENFPMDAVNIELLEKLTEPMGFTQKLTDVFTGFSQLEAPLLRQIINKFIPLIADFAPEFTEDLKSNPQGLKKVINGIKQNLPIALRDKTSLSRLADYFNKLYDAIAETEAILAANEKNGAASARLREAVTELRQQLEFMDHINNFKNYIQIPLNINGTANNAELFIFKNPKKANAQRERLSVLIAIDYEHIGRVETFIDCAGKSVALQFRAIYPETLKLLNNNFGDLSAKFAADGVNITRVSFKNIDEPFTILNDINITQDNPQDKRRYSFDMRV